MKPRQIALVVSKKNLYQPDNDVGYWRAQPYQARLAALEEIRQEYHRWKKAKINTGSGISRKPAQLNKSGL